MSIGDLRDSGNQGNNLPYQWKVLQGLQSILTQLQATLSADVRIIGPLNNQQSADSVSVVLTDDQFKRAITPNILKQTGVTGNLAVDAYSISFASNGTAAARVSFDGGVTFEDLPPGTTVNMDAGGLGWIYTGDIFYWDTLTNAGSSLIITWNS
jgi:hypothetical protein